MNLPVRLADREVGPGRPAFLVAEVSANHDRDPAQALALIDVAADAGVDAVKLQTYGPDSLTVPTTHPSARVDPVWGAANLRELYAGAAMPYEFHQPLFDRARERGLIAFSSAYAEADVDFLEALGNPIYKVASFELPHLPLLRHVGQTRKPVILSTGMATLAEVEEAVGTLVAAGCPQVVLLHCCSAYPAPADSVNLAAMRTLREAFHCPTGFSDHTLGFHVAVAAVALGACVVEKHFTNDPRRPGPDHRFSASPTELRALVHAVREIESAIGTGLKGTATCEAGNKAVGRRSLFTSGPIPAGTVITAELLRVVRPGSGLAPRFREIIIGRRARRDIPAYWPITWEDV